MKFNKNTTIIVAAIALIMLATVMLLFRDKSMKPISQTQYSSSIEKLQTQSDSTQVSDIERDLNETNLSDLDKEMTDIDKELNSAY
jgi:hypothetical protein